MLPLTAEWRCGMIPFKKFFYHDEILLEVWEGQESSEFSIREDLSVFAIDEKLFLLLDQYVQLV